MTTEERRDAIVASYLGMEQQVHEVASMAFAACLMIDLFQEEFRAMAADPTRTAAELVKHTEQWLQAADFSVHHVNDMAKALKSHYAAHPN